MCCGPRWLPEPLVPCGQEGFGQFAIAKVRPIWGAVYVRGGTLLPRGSSAQYVPKHWESQPSSHFYLRSSQPATRRGMRPPFETEGDGQRSSWIDFSAGAVALINVSAAHTVPLYVSVFPLGWDVTETAVSRRRSDLQVVRLGLHFLVNNYNALTLIQAFLTK